MSNLNYLKKLKYEKVVVVLFLLLLMSIFSAWKIFQRQESYGDTAFVTQLSNNIAHTGKPVTQLMSSIDIILEKCVMAPAEKLCSMSFNIPPNHDFNYFKKWHTYLILYILAPFNYIFSAEIFLAVFTIISFFTVLFLTYWILRRRNIPLLPTALLMLFISLHPAWSYSIQGQIYVDRFFIGLGFIFVYLLNEYNNKTFLIFLTGLLLTLISDRTGLIAGSIIIGHEILFSINKSKKINKKNIYSGISFALISIYLMKFYLSHPHLASFASSLSISGILSNLSNQTFATNMVFFLILNVIIYGIFGIFSLKYFAISLALMIPNIFGNIGGAEKVGFLTHYHSLYFPTLAWAVLDGFANLYNNEKLTSSLQNKWKITANFICVALIAIISSSSTGSTSNLSISKENFYTQAWYVAIRDLRSYVNGYKNEYNQDLNNLVSSLPKNSAVATVESFMNRLISGHDVYFFPIGIEDVQYIVLPFSEDSPGNFIYFGAATHLGQEEAKKIDICLRERMIALNFDVNNPVKFRDYALIKKKTSF